jgi:succinoglycan biosynthesis transport protein ExoP
MTLLDGVRIVRRFWMTIAFCILIAVGLAAAYAAQLPRLYTASAQAYVRVGSGDGSVAEASVSNNVASAKAAAYAPLTTSGLVAERVVEDLGLDLSVATVSGSISYTVDPDSPRIQVFVTSASPQQARDVANAVVAATAEVASFVESGSENASGTVQLIPVTNAVAPSAPSSPNVGRLLLVGLGAGIVLAYVVVMLRMRLDTRIRRPEDIADVTELGLMGTIPRSRDLKQRLHSEDLLRGAVGESLRHLRTNLMFADPDHPPRSVAVTSPMPAEGKSTVSALLARALAMRGEPVVLVDGDLRRPMVATLFDVPSGVGLTQVLSGAVPLDEAVADTDTVGLRVLPAGRIPHNPSEVLGSARMRDLLTELAKDHIVIVDAPPALPVTDAMILAQRVDGLLVVTNMGSSRKENLRRVLQLAGNVNARVFGVVLNGIPQGRAAGVYGYETYGYYHTDKGGHRRRRRDKAAPPPARTAEAELDVPLLGEEPDDYPDGHEAAHGAATRQPEDGGRDEAGPADEDGRDAPEQPPERLRGPGVLRGRRADRPVTTPADG